ncbi:MAG: hypothetical protein ACEY3J_03645 [Arsenophonus sp.]
MYIRIDESGKIMMAVKEDALVELCKDATLLIAITVLSCMKEVDLDQIAIE